MWPCADGFRRDEAFAGAPDIHPVIAAHQLAVVRLAILQLDQHRVARRRAEQGERQH